MTTLVKRLPHELAPDLGPNPRSPTPQKSPQSQTLKPQSSKSPSPRNPERRAGNVPRPRHATLSHQKDSEGLTSQGLKAWNTCRWEALWKAEALCRALPRRRSLLQGGKPGSIPSSQVADFEVFAIEFRVSVWYKAHMLPKVSSCVSIPTLL